MFGYKLVVLGTIFGFRLVVLGAIFGLGFRIIKIKKPLTHICYS